MTERRKRVCYYIPVDAYVEGEGFRVSVVTEGMPGHRPTGNWPYNGGPGEVRPYFWGHDYEKACDAAAAQNARMGLSKADTNEIILSSMFAKRRSRRRRVRIEMTAEEASKLRGES